MLNASLTGMWIETRAPLELRARVQVELRVASGLSAAIGGRVIRANSSGFAVQLAADASNLALRSSFLQAATVEGLSAPTVVLRRAGRGVEVDPCRVVDPKELSAKWWEVIAALDSDAAHQAFIHACLRQRSLDFALERYRELALDADAQAGAAAARYLKQLGTILGFCALERVRPAHEAMPRGKKLILAAVAVAALLALVLFSSAESVEKRMAARAIIALTRAPSGG